MLEMGEKLILDNKRYKVTDTITEEDGFADWHGYELTDENGSKIHISDMTDRYISVNKLKNEKKKLLKQLESIQEKLIKKNEEIEIYSELLK